MMIIRYHRFTMRMSIKGELRLFCSLIHSFTPSLLHSFSPSLLLSFQICNYSIIFWVYVDSTSISFLGHLVQCFYSGHISTLVSIGRFLRCSAASHKWPCQNAANRNFYYCTVSQHSLALGGFPPKVEAAFAQDGRVRGRSLSFPT